MAKRMIAMLVLMIALIAGLAFIKFRQFQAMIIGTIFTLFVVPSIYVLVARRHLAVEQEPARDSALVAGEAASAV